MSPRVPSLGTFSVKYTGRPKMLMGGACDMLLAVQPPIHTPGADWVIAARAGNTSMEQIHTALPRDDGSILAYMLAKFASVTAVVRAPPAPTATMAGAFRNPSGSPTPGDVMNARSSNQVRARGKFWAKNPANPGASARSPFGPHPHPVRFFPSRTTPP